VVRAEAPECDEGFENAVEQLRTSSTIFRVRRPGRLPRQTPEMVAAGVAEGSMGGSGSVMVTLERVAGFRGVAVERMPDAPRDAASGIVLPPGHGWATYLLRCFDLSTSAEHLLLVTAPPGPHYPRTPAEAAAAQAAGETEHPGVLSLAGRVPPALLHPSASTHLARVLCEHLVAFRGHETLDSPHGNPALPVPAQCSRGGLSLHTFSLGSVLDATADPMRVAGTIQDKEDEESGGSSDPKGQEHRQTAKTTNAGAASPASPASSVGSGRVDAGLGAAGDEDATSTAFLEAVEELEARTLIRAMRDAGSMGATRGKLSVSVGRVDEVAHGDPTFGGELPAPGLRLPNTQRVFLVHALEARTMHEFAALVSVEATNSCTHKTDDFPAVHFVHFPDAATSDLALAQRIADHCALDRSPGSFHSKPLALWGGLTIEGAVHF
jgi:hypothetical protein